MVHVHGKEGNTNILQIVLAWYHNCTYLNHLPKYLAKRKINCSKMGYETKSGLRTQDLLYSYVESYAVCIRVDVIEPVQILYTCTA